jgi:hypothetical protein
MTDPAAQILAELQQLDRRHAVEQRELNDRQQQERRALVARAMLTSEPKVVGGGTGPMTVPPDLIGPKQAQREFRLSKASLARIGESNPHLCFFDERGRRMYSKALLGAHLKQHPLRRQTTRAPAFRSPSGPK